MHPSHVASFYRGVHFCVACGGWRVKASKKLAKPCTKHPTDAGKQFLKSIEAGRLPQGLTSWPGL